MQPGSARVKRRAGPRRRRPGTTLLAPRRHPDPRQGFGRRPRTGPPGSPARRGRRRGAFGRPRPGPETRRQCPSRAAGPEGDTRRRPLASVGADTGRRRPPVSPRGWPAPARGVRTSAPDRARMARPRRRQVIRLRDRRLTRPPSRSPPQRKGIPHDRPRIHRQGESRQARNADRAGYVAAVILACIIPIPYPRPERPRRPARQSRRRPRPPTSPR